jgi:restriction system protein
MVFDYKKLKMGKHDLPTWDGVIPVVMSIVSSKKEWRNKDLTRTVADALNLPENLRLLSYEKYGDNIIENHVAWANSDLALAGLLTRPRRGIYQITTLGQQLQTKYGLNLTAKIVHAQPLYQQHLKELTQRKQTQLQVASKHETEAPAQSVVQHMIRQETDYNNAVATELLARIREAEPVFFEHLVTHLLSKMGYQGPDGNVKVTPPSRDGGIDGIINQDPLGTNTVYIQAKRYQATNIVQRPAIDAFYGALSRVHADRGVFITTSSFSNEAIETAKTFSIVLIDGIRLTDLMLKYHVGVQTKQKFELFEIDEDYFEV